MERHRTLDSSMSSLYSGSNVSQTPTSRHHNDATMGATTSYNNYTGTIVSTSSAAPSPTPSAGHLLMATTNGNDNMIDTNANSSAGGGGGGGGSGGGGGGGGGGSSSSTGIGGLRATTIGTVVVRCGPIQLVIALLQSIEKLYIKVVELEPKITTLGANLDESLTLQKQHDETLRNIQNLPGPMEEFVHKADKLLASKRISSELVNAMADTLNVIWSDILHLLQDRQHILHLCAQFHEKMLQCQRRMDQLEQACTDTMIPIEVSAVQEFLNKFKQLRIDMLTAVMAALKDGNELLAQLQELESMETLDTRPEHIKRDALRAVHQVQQWLESLHDRRNALEIAWQTRKNQLEQCLTLALLGRELLEVETALQEQRHEISTTFCLGECEHSSSLALKNYKEWKQQALLLRDRALKITRAKEKLQSSGSFSGDEACARAYNILSACTEHLDLVDQREHWLQQSRDFFNKAEHILKVLEKLEVELSNVRLPTNSPESFAMYNKVARDVNNFTEEPLRLGYCILDEVGRTLPETQGIKRVLDEIENRKVYIERICDHSTEDHRKVQRALDEFLTQYNDLLDWLKSSGHSYLQQNVRMGINLEQSKQFLLQHHELMQDLEIKGELINLLLESIKTHLESLSAQQRYDVDSKAEALHKHWIDLKDMVLKRVDYVTLLIEFFEKTNELASQIDNLKRQLSQTPNEQKLQFLEETWQNIRGNFTELKTLGTRFLSTKILDLYLETKSSAIAVEDILNDFSKQQIDVTTSLESWTTHIAEKREVEIILEKIMSENEETTLKTTKVDTQLYPIFTTSSVDAQYLHSHSIEKLKLVLKDIDQAQNEIQERVHTTLAIHTKDTESMQKIEQVISNLRTLKSKLDGIRYDYKTLLENVLQFLDNVAKLRKDIDEYFVKQKQQQQQPHTEAIERCIAEHEKFRDLSMDKFRSLITQSELLIDRVRILEPAGAKEIDTDRILKLLEDLRLHFETCNGERMSTLERLERLEQFKNDLNDINRSLDSVSHQLSEINNQNIDSLAAAKTTSLAFEYFERTIELLEKRIEKFTENTKQQLLITNPESESYVREQLIKIAEKWQQFKDQVKQKRNALNQASEFFEVVEKIDAEHHEISYFYNSVSNKITYLRDSIEAKNLINDIEKYVNEREKPLREKLDSAAKCPHDMNKVSQLYNDVMTIFQNFAKLKSDISVVQERLKNEERMREQQEKEARERAERECAKREAEARERAAQEEEARLQTLREQSAREQAERERLARELAAREKAIWEEEQRLLIAREKATREQAVREEELKHLRNLREEEARIRAAQEKAAKEQAIREQALREEQQRLQAACEQAAREQMAREQAAREEELSRLRALREEEARLQAAREQAEREQIAREQLAREEELARLRALREEEKRLQAAREQAAREQLAREQLAREQAAREQVAREEELARLRALREEETRLQAAREQSAREQLAREQAAREQEKIRLKALHEEELRIQRLRAQAIHEEEIRLQKLREQARHEEEVRLKAMREEELRLATLREQSQREEVKRLQSLTKEVEVFTPLKYEVPLFVAPLQPAIAYENEKFIFECAVSGLPEPTIEWFKDGVSIQGNSDYKTTYDKGLCRLVIDETFAADSAHYTCRATNMVGVGETSANLSVRENVSNIQMIPPHIVRFLESSRAKEGSAFEFACTVTGNPLPTVQWYKNDKCIDDSPDYVICYNNGEAKLRFEEVFLEDDAIYTCSASNTAGIEHCSASLVVEPLEPTEIPHFKIPLSNVMARVGQKIKLEALIGGLPIPDICWLHNGKPYKPREMKYEYGRITLIIPQAYPNDAGVYVLTAKNLAGEVYSSCNVTIKGRLPNETSDSEMASDMEPIKPNVQMPLKDISIFEGKSVRLDCVIVGQPEPEVIWYHNERPVKESVDIQLLFQGDRCSLIIQEVYQEDAGNYKVVAINSAGEASSSCELKVTPLNIAEPATRAQTERQSQSKELEPKFEKFLSDVLVDEGETVVMEVITSGDKPMEAKWFLTNKELSEDERMHIEANGTNGVFRLTIKNVNTDDKGVYTVKVSNSSGDAKCFSHLIVKSVNAPESQRPQQVDIVEKLTRPEFKEVFSDKTVNLEEVVKFECIVKGKPTPKVHWCFNDQPVHGHNFLVSTSGERQVLTVQNAGPETVGKITCIAENEVGRAECVAFLGLVGSGLEAMPAQSNLQTVTQEDNTESSRVTFKKQTFTSTSTSQVQSFEGNMPQTELHHSSTHIDQSLKQFGNQRPEIIETHKYQELHKDKEMSSPTMQQKSFVLVQSASNDASNAIVPSSPTRTRKEIAPRFTTPLTGKIVDQGVDVSLEALYDGFPSPDIKVIKNGEELFDNERLKISNKCNRITIELKQVNVNDAGRYAVTASNAMGQSTSTADLVVKKTIFPPVFGRRLQAQVVKKDEKIIMEVEVTGLPEPTVVWMKDEKPLSEANLSSHRLLNQGNSHKLIIENGQIGDSGKYMVKATNAGGEAKSIADCAILEPTTERAQEVAKTIDHKTATEFKTEDFTREPMSFQTNHSEVTTATDLHGLSESKITTEHRCTTEATVRLEHKSPITDLPQVGQQRTKAPTEQSVNTHTQLLPTSIKTTNNQDIIDHLQHSQTVFDITDNTHKKPIPPPEPFKPTCPSALLPTPSSTSSVFDQAELNSTMTSTNNEEKTSTSFEYFKKIDQDILEKPSENNYKKYEVKQAFLASDIKYPQTNLEEDFKSLNLIPGPPPEICYIPKPEQTATRPQMISEKIKKLEENQLQEKDKPKGGVPILPPAAPASLGKETDSIIKSNQSIMKSVDTLSSPGQRYTRSPSPKPSAEALAMEKLWTPNNHVSGYESCTSDLEQSVPDFKVPKLSTPTKELRAPFLVKQITNLAPFSSRDVPRMKSPIDHVQLKPGTPPEICFAPEPEQRRQSIVQTMEKTLEKNLIQSGPSKVLPLSVPTLTPAPTLMSASSGLNKSFLYKPPPPVMANKIGRREYYESDYESDRWKYSGSESDENCFRVPLQKAYQPTLKTNGYAADTEEMSSFIKMESSVMEKKSLYESNNSESQPTAFSEKFRTTTQQPLYFPSFVNGGQDKQESRSISENKYHHEDKDYKCTSMTKNISYQMSSASSGGGMPQFRPVKAPLSTTPIPVPAQRKTPAEFSDYSSEIDERFRSVSRNYESESDIKGYRVVYPPMTIPKSNGYKSPIAMAAPSPMEFEPTPLKPKFEPIRKEMHHEMKTESKQQTRNYQSQKQQPTPQVFKPKPVAAKYLASAQQHQQQQNQQQQPQREYKSQPQFQPQSQPTMYYKAIAGTPVHLAKMATETQNIMQMKESSETCERVVNMQQTKKVIHFDNQKNQRTLETLPYSPTPSPRITPVRQQRMPPPATPTRFVPGEFRESDYENEIENAKIAPLWTPMGESGPLRFRHVEPPRPGRSCSLPRTYERVLSPLEFDKGPEMPTKIQVDANALRNERSSNLTNQSRHQTFNRQSSMRSSDHRYCSTLYEQDRQQQQQQQQEQQSQSFSRDDMNLKVGSPPKYGYIPPQVEKQGKAMGSTLKQKTHKFMEDISQDMQKFSSKTLKTTFVNGPTTSPEHRVVTPTFRPIFKRAPSEGDNRPQAYRDETRVSQYGTKCVDPNTGLIYFKYDFGYEFGILFPGEGHKFVTSQWNKSSSTLPTAEQQFKGTINKKSPYPLPVGRDINIPVYHERSTIPSYAKRSSPYLNSDSTHQGYYSDYSETLSRPAVKTTFRPCTTFNRLPQRRNSLPSTRIIDINIDRFHSNDTLKPRTYSVTDLATKHDEPVNAYLNREDYPQKPPTFITPLKDRAVVPGQTARFECIVQCHPQPDVGWHKNGYDLENNQKHQLEYRNGVCRLTIPHAYPDDAGSYGCSAVNPLGRATTCAELQVTGKYQRP
ncbi:titin homolog isoform X7 [Glossina fuscipes]|uniref:Titin homolog isoform X7 n=1 Tax=Glossina fuscipes TaxID=7396 RepID=A0A9C5ZQ59_9MUSC|nr:titin homolog isoform X7 [Glossina fuscipes]